MLIGKIGKSVKDTKMKYKIINRDLLTQRYIFMNFCNQNYEE